MDTTVANTIFADRSSYIALDEDDFTAGGAMRVSCDCGYRGFVDVDDDGSHLRGNCSDCDSAFKVSLF